MSKVFISAGHGGVDSGAVGNGLKEKDINLSIASACRDYLEDNGVVVKMSRITDENDDVNSEVSESNAFGPDVTVSIHNNSGGGDGVETWYSVVGGISKVCAENILNEVMKIGQNSRGAKMKVGNNGRDYYGFIRMTKAPAVIVECAFIDNPKDVAIVDTNYEQKIMGIAITKRILKTLGVKDPNKEQIKNNKSIHELAMEVIAGKWGNGSVRKNRLTTAGYDYRKIQNEVNKILK